MGIEGEGANDEVEGIKSREESNCRGEEKESDFGSALMSARSEDKAHVEEVSEGVGDEEGDTVIDRRAFETKLITHCGVEGGINGATENVDEGPVHEEGAATTEEVFAKLLRPRGKEGEEFLKGGGHLSEDEALALSERANTRC